MAFREKSARERDKNDSKSSGVERNVIKIKRTMRVGGISIHWAAELEENKVAGTGRSQSGIVHVH